MKNLVWGQDYRDDGPSIEENPHAKTGNFLALLQFQVQAGDRVLKEHLKTAPGNVLYASKTVQNQMIAIGGEIEPLCDECCSSSPWRSG